MNQPKKSFEEIEEILSNIKYKNWRLRIMEYHEDVVLCQWIFMALDNDKLGEEGSPLDEQRCRKWYISKYSTNSEIVRTTYKAVKEAEMYEVDENFLFMNMRIYDPHINIYDIVAGIREDSITQDVRIPLKQ